MKRRTKIVATLGPSVDSKEKIKALIDAGVNVIRINCSHGNWDTRRQWVKWAREACNGLSPIAIMADLQGPKFRIGDLPGGAQEFVVGQSVTVGSSASATLPVHMSEILAEMSAGCKILLGDGQVEVKISAQKGADFEGKVVNGGVVKSRQGITLVGKVFDVPSLTEKDIEDVKEAAAVGADFIALSYIRSAADVRDLRREVDKYDKTIQLCAKIETRDGLKNIDDILKVTDVVMVARGDMGLQMDIEDVPLAQKRIIERCSEASKPVITATQMLESMMFSPRPTRAEATDVANAILDGTDAVMLSGETAAGQYPLDCVRTMVRIAERAEPVYDRARVESRFFDKVQGSGLSQTEAVCHSAAGLSAQLKAHAIVTTTVTGLTARSVSKFRPKVPILCTTFDDRTKAQLAIIWGVEAMSVKESKTIDETIQDSIAAFFRAKRLKVGDSVVVVAGMPVAVAGHTNMIWTETIK
jgi:pyruvate kinase